MAFATVDDIQVRLGRAPTEAEAAMAEQGIEIVTGLIADVVGETDAWAENLDPVPAYYRLLCIEKVLKVGANPALVQSITEQLGSFATTKSFPRYEEMGFGLTDAERRQIKRVYAGSTFQSLTLETPYSGDVVDDLELDLEVGS